MWFTIQIKQKLVENKEKCGVKWEYCICCEIFDVKTYGKNFRLWKSGLGGVWGP